MRKIFFLLLAIVLSASLTSAAASPFEEDIISTSTGDLKITFIGHGTLMMTAGDTVIHIDPWSKLADYSQLPQADIILVTHEHFDHLDPQALTTLRKEDTHVVLTEKCQKELHFGTILQNGDSITLGDIRIDAVPAYNILHKRDNGQPFHPKGEGNGYILTISGKRIYIAGDTENIPEMKALSSIDCAFLPMNLPYTMTPEMVADAAIAFKPAILYPYHYGETDPRQLVELLREQKQTEIRIRRMQ